MSAQRGRTQRECWAARSNYPVGGLAGKLTSRNSIARRYMGMDTDLILERQAPRRRFLESAGGTRVEAFGRLEWLLLTSIALIWGSSFVLIDVGLDSLRP